MGFKRAILFTIDNDIYEGFQRIVGRGNVSAAVEQYFKMKLIEGMIDAHVVRIVKCPKCGIENSDTLLYCKSCDSRLIPLTPISDEAEARRLAELDKLMKEQGIL